MIGIYKITNPNNKVYIGQSRNIKRRFSTYKRLDCKKQVKLFNSLNKYGVINHTFEVLIELDKNVSQEVLNNYEIYYMDEYNKSEIELLNIREGGSRGKLSQITIELLREINLGKFAGDKNPFYGKKHSEETIEFLRNKQLGNKHSEETINKLRKINLGEKNAFYGKKHSEESIKKMRESSTGKKVQTYKHKKSQCPHCDFEGSGGNMKRYHFDNCKYLII